MVHSKGIQGCPQNFVGTYTLRQHSLHSLVHDSSEDVKMCPTRKKTDICVFFIFSSNMPKSVEFFITKSVVFLSKNGQNPQKKCLIRKKV